MTNLSVSDFTQPIMDANSFCSTAFRAFCDELRYKVNNVTAGVSTTIEVTGDLTFNVTNLYFANSLWPLELPTGPSVLYRDSTGTLSWRTPVSLNLSPAPGHIELFFGSTAPSGWVIYNGGTIGNGASGGTCRANADTQDLFTVLWNNLSNTAAPVSSGRGSDASSDFSANKTISLTGLATALLSTRSTQTQFQNAGTNSLMLTAAMLPNHSHQAYHKKEFDSGTFVSGSPYSVNINQSLAKGGSYTCSIWSDEFHIYGDKYDTQDYPSNSPTHQPQSGMNIQQPSTNVNLIIKL